jgi:hypothetical protein
MCENGEGGVAGAGGTEAGRGPAHYPALQLRLVLVRQAKPRRQSLSVTGWIGFARWRSTAFVLCCFPQGSSSEFLSPSGMGLPELPLCPGVAARPSCHPKLALLSTVSGNLTLMVPPPGPPRLPPCTFHLPSPRSRVVAIEMS